MENKSENKDENNDNNKTTPQKIDNEQNKENKNRNSQRTYKYLTLPKLKDSKTKKYSLSLYNKEKQRQKERYDEKLREKLLELEECEKKFDIEIYNTLSKLNEEEKRLYDS